MQTSCHGIANVLKKFPLGFVCASRNRSSVTMLAKGNRYTMERTFTPEDVNHFLKLTGDPNGIHIDRAAALAAGLESPILPGMLCASLFPAVIARQFPGILYLSQDLNFRASAQVGDSTRADVEVQQIRGRYVKFKTHCFNSQGSLLIDGSAFAKLAPG